jgi:hypothetical protein
MHAITRTETSARLNVIPTPRADATLQTGGELEGGEHRRPGTGSRDRLRSAAWAVVSGRLGLALAIAALLGVLEAWATRGDGYTAGWGDHFVLSPEGLSWAIPGAFENDWFMAVAPQPHWFFDVVTFVGQSVGHLSAVYALFWGVGLLAFGAATSLLAFRFVPGVPWLVAIGFTLLASVTPWMVGGTGSPIIAQALPAVTAASLVYLAIAALITEVRWVAILAAPLVAVVHVQQGAVIAIILLVSLAVEAILKRKVDWRVVAALVLTIALVAFGLLLRPVASNLNDFVEICDRVIPYHCAAHLWSWPETAATIGLILLSASTYFLVPRHSRLLWLSTVGLATTGYALGFAADRLHLPIVGALAQGINVYRLGAVILPFAIWGVFLPILRPDINRTAWVRFTLWGVGLWCFIQSPNGFPPYIASPVFALFVLVVAAYAVGSSLRQRRSRPFVVGVASLLLGSLFLFLSAGTGGIAIRSPQFQFIKDPALVEWGGEVREQVPVGSTIIASPRAEWMKIVTQRAVAVDCKDIPYGGEPWRQWKQRIEDFGGIDQCVAPGPLLYNELSGRQLVHLADRYESDFIAVDPTLTDTVEQLEGLGWQKVVDLVGQSGLPIFTRDG